MVFHIPHISFSFKLCDRFKLKAEGYIMQHMRKPPPMSWPSRCYEEGFRTISFFPYLFLTNMVSTYTVGWITP